jgi:transketolase
MRNAFIRGLTALAQQDQRVVLLTGDLGYRIFDEFAGRFPGRFFNAGVAEANMTGVAAGLALGGLRPFTYSIVPFATLRCLEQIRNDICYNNAGVAIVGVGGGYSYGPNGPSHHGLEDIAVMRALPNMTVVCPGDPVEAELAVLASASHRGAIYLRLGRAGDPVVHLQPPQFCIGQAITLRQGTDCALISTGGMLPVAVAAADLLEAEGISSRVVSMHTVKPLDQATLRGCCLECRAMFTLEEHSMIGGLGAAVAEWLTANDLRCRLRCFGTADRFMHCSGSQAYLRQRDGLAAEQIAAEVSSWLKEHRRC